MSSRAPSLTGSTSLLLFAAATSAALSVPPRLAACDALPELRWSCLAVLPLPVLLCPADAMLPSRTSTRACTPYSLLNLDSIAGRCADNTRPRSVCSNEICAARVWCVIDVLIETLPNSADRIPTRISEPCMVWISFAVV